MRKLKLFLMACALMGAGQAWAQTDVTSTYITDADFASIDGWTQNHSDGTYWALGNGLIGSYAVVNEKTSTTDETHLDTEYCLGMQCRWGSSYASFQQIKKNATLPAGAYTISYDVENTNTSTKSGAYQNHFYAKIGETTYADNSTEWMTNSTGWTTHTISFALEEATTANFMISFGYGTGSLNEGYGSGATPHLYVSHLKIEYAAIVRPTAVSIDETLTLDVGGTATLTPTYTPSDANTDLDITWTTSDSYVATVANGVVTAIGPGTATITATTANGVEATCAVTVNRPQAQLWTGSEVGEGYALLYNVGTGKYFTRGNGWTTQASIGDVHSAIPVNLVAMDDKYFISTMAAYNSDYGLECLADGPIYTDQSREKKSTWTFVEIDATNHIYNIVSADNHAGGSDKYLTAEGGTSTILGPGSNRAFLNAQWIIYLFSDQKTKTLAAMPNATADNPVDATALIDDADFSSSLFADAWTVTASNKNLCGGNYIDYCAETFRNGGGKIYQTITVPNGTYKVKCQGFYDVRAGDTPSYFYVNDETPVALQVCNGNNEGTALSMSGASTSFSAGLYENDEIQVVVTGKSLTIGIEGQDGNWTCFDNFRLSYLGPLDLSEYQTALANAVAAAEATEGTIPAACYSAIAAVVSENNNTYDDSDGYEAAIDAIDAAVSTYASSEIVAAYAAYKVAAQDAVIAGVDASAQNTAVEEATTVAAIEDCTAALRTAIAAATSFDITTFTIQNPTPVAHQDLPANWEGDRFGDASDGVSEYWNKSGADFHQTIANLPAGRYCLTVVALQRTGMTGTVYAGENSTIIAQVARGTVNSRSQAASWFNAGNGRNYVYFELAEATDITIGLKADETLDDHWTVWKSFKLDTFDESVAAGYLAPGWTTLVGEAKATLDDAAYANVTGEEKTALEAAIAATPSTVAEYEAAVEALNTAVAAFIAAKTNYDIYATERALADAISTDITVDAPTSAENALTQFRALKVAEYNYVATAYPYSATSKIGDFSGWTRSGSVNGNTNVTFESLTSQHWSGTAMTYYEQPVGGWSSTGAAFTANYEKVCTLPAGKYVIKVAARAASGNNTTAKITCTAATLEGPIFNFGDTGKGITTAGVASFDEGEFCNNGNGRGWVWNYLPFELTEETEVTMTVHAEANGVMQWFSVCDGELLSKTNIATAVAYDETVANTIVDVDVANVTMARTIEADYNTVCLPFDLTANQVQTAFGSGTEVYAFSEDSSNPMDVTINFNKVIAGTISANVPVLVKATAASTEQKFDGVEVKAADEAKVEGTNFDFVGTYAPAIVAAGDYFIGNGALYKSAGNTSINAFRAYLKAKTQGATVRMFINGNETTGIENVNVNLNDNNNVNYYDLQGRRVNQPKKGLYIVNGKKMVVK